MIGKDELAELLREDLPDWHQTSRYQVVAHGATALGRSWQARRNMRGAFHGLFRVSLELRIAVAEEKEARRVLDEDDSRAPMSKLSEVDRARAEVEVVRKRLGRMALEAKIPRLIESFRFGLSHSIYWTRKAKAQKLTTEDEMRERMLRFAALDALSSGGRIGKTTWENLLALRNGSARVARDLAKSPGACIQHLFAQEPAEDVPLLEIEQGAIWELVDESIHSINSNGSCALLASSPMGLPLEGEAEGWADVSMDEP